MEILVNPLDEEQKLAKVKEEEEADCSCGCEDGGNTFLVFW